MREEPVMEDRGLIYLNLHKLSLGKYRETSRVNTVTILTNIPSHKRDTVKLFVHLSNKEKTEKSVICKTNLLQRGKG
jgi:hypothetical protein